MDVPMRNTKVVRYQVSGQAAYGVIEDGVVHSLKAGPWDRLSPGPAVASLDDLGLLAPCQPTKIVAVGLNYAAHAAEAGHEIPAEPLFFLKPPSTVVGPGAEIVYPAHLSHWVEHEAELAVVIGRRAQRVRPEQALDYVLGYTCANDVTARDLQRRDNQWTRSKSFDTFCPLGPWIVTGLDVSDLAVRCSVNGELRQAGRTQDLFFSVDLLIAHASAVMTLEPGDVVLTGTPAGVGPLLPGDRVSVEIDDIGVLENEVVDHG
jgi:2-keto-4-pentenoate hydratase/2-oxohepta-3-ene-1,7-dioic acid hydratase in catechol pathway